MGKDIGCGYFLKITTIKLEGRKRLGSTFNYSIIIFWFSIFKIFIKNRSRWTGPE